MLIIFIFFLIIIIYKIKNKNNSIEPFKNYTQYTFEIQQPYKIGFTYETQDLLILFKNKLNLKPEININSTQILNDINTNKIDFGIVYDNFINNNFSNVKKFSYINFSSHLLLSYDNSINNILDLQDKTICFGLENSDSFKIGQKIFNLLKINIIIYIPKTLKELITDFNSNKYDVLYLNIFAPNYIITQLNLDNLNFIDITKNIDKNLLYRINILKYKNSKYLNYKNNTTINNPSNNIWFVCNKNTNPTIINNIFNILINLKNYNIKINNKYLNLNNITNITIDDNEATKRNKILNDKLFNSFYYNSTIDYHPIIIQKYIQLGYITNKKNIDCIFKYKKNSC